MTTAAQRRRRVALVALLVLAGATYVVTWPLWQSRPAGGPVPLLPLVPVIGLRSAGWVLLASLVLAAVRPAVGSLVHAVVVVLAVFADQTRLQPEVVSLALLTVAVAVPPVVWLGRAHLLAVWGYSGLWKAASPSFRLSGGREVVASVWSGAPAAFAARGWMLVVSLEVGTALLALFARTRRAAVGLAVLLHGSILWVLVVARGGSNVAVWPWQIALVVGAWVLIGGWRESVVQSFTSMRPAVAAGVVAIALLPPLWLAGITDAYLAHHLYSGAVPSADRCSLAAGAECVPVGAAVARALDVPLPPEPRLFVSLFRRTCFEGEWLVVSDPRGWLRDGDSRLQAFGCRAAG